jgi:hypothetical protein
MESRRSIQLLQVIDGKLVDTMSNQSFNEKELDNLLKSLTEWFGEKWVDISRPKKGGGYRVTKENVEKVAEDLAEEEAALADALVTIAANYGKFNEDETGIWAGYDSPEDNEVGSIGVKCANCVLYESDGVCKIIAQQVEEEGKCRFAVIPDGLVMPEMDDEYEEEDDTEENSMSTLISMIRDLLNNKEK